MTELLKTLFLEIQDAETEIYNLHTNTKDKIISTELALLIIESVIEDYKDRYVSRSVLDQVMRERDVAIEQLKELGYGLGEKVG